MRDPVASLMFCTVISDKLLEGLSHDEPAAGEDADFDVALSFLYDHSQTDPHSDILFFGVRLVERTWEDAENLVDASKLLSALASTSRTTLLKVIHQQRLLYDKRFTPPRPALDACLERLAAHVQTTDDWGLRLIPSLQ